jgi:hypothetical protein
MVLKPVPILRWFSTARVGIEFVFHDLILGDLKPVLLVLVVQQTQRSRERARNGTNMLTLDYESSDQMKRES